MKWIVQEFLNSNNINSVRVMVALENLSIDYLIVRVNNDRTLSVLDKESKLPYDNSEFILSEFIENSKVMVYGSKTIAEIAKEMRLSPGSFMNDQFEFEVFLNVLGEDLLNNEFEIGELSELKPEANEFFIRPTGNTKLFTGMVVTKEEFMLWQSQGYKKYVGEKLMISPIRDIKAEYRFFVVNQKVVTGSSYVVKNKLNNTREITEELLIYTKRMVEKFPLAQAFVIDIAETKDGFKVLEYNNINSSGLYGCNEFYFVKSINYLFN